ncbi:MAG TPA: hypothetical protein VF312_09570 [Propionibacteriaceae bacterium]|jgi:hypothetical protein
MLRRLSLALGTAALVASLAAGGALAAANPVGTGQPNQSCQAELSGPPGLLSTTNGFFRVAVNVYAGSGANTSTPANFHAVSQYDVACFQVSQH